MSKWGPEWVGLKNKDVRWKTVNICSDDCWCRCIVIESATEEQINDFELKNPVYIIEAGHLSIVEAEYFVELHNERLEK